MKIQRFQETLGQAAKLRQPSRGWGQHKRTFAATGLGALLLASGCSNSQEQPEDRRPNLLVISVDTLRADRLSCFGHTRETSPNIDRLAQEGVLFRDAQAPTSWTLPSHATMMTGLPISVHGLCDHRIWTQDSIDVLALRGTYLAEVMQSAGYATGGFFSWKFLEPEFGFGSGFDNYERVAYSLATIPGLGKRLSELRKAGRNEEAKQLLQDNAELLRPDQSSGHHVIDKAVSWLDEHGVEAEGNSDSKEQPFFLFVHLFDVHDPYTPPEPFNKFDPDYEGPVDGLEVSSNSSVVNPKMKARDLEHLQALYDGEIAWTDAQIGRLLEHLEAAGELDNTLIVLTADHGEEFFEHGLKTHRKQLFKESVHVPLIMRLPETLKPATVVEEPVGLVDLLPTVCNLLELKTPPGVWGRDLTPLMHGQWQAPPAYLTELQHFESETSPVRKLGLRLGQRRFLLEFSAGSGTTPQAITRFDLQEDPRETDGLTLQSNDAEWLEVTGQLESLRAQLRKSRASLPTRPMQVRVLEGHEMEELRLLGYIDDGTAEVADGFEANDRLCIDGCIWK